MDRPRPTSAVGRLESTRSALELTASIVAATVQLVTFAAAVRRTLRGVGKRSTRAT